MSLIPLDHKVFTFYGVVRFIFPVDRNHSVTQRAFFDGDFNPIADGLVHHASSKMTAPGVHRRPDCQAARIQLAHTRSIDLKAPFISIDCYATAKGPVLGELTHTPGGPWFGGLYRFSDAFDRDLGTAWRDALKRLGREIPFLETSYVIRWKNGEVARRIPT